MHEQLDHDKDEHNMVAQWVVHARDIKDQRPQAETSGNARASALSAVTGDEIMGERERERVCVVFKADLWAIYMRRSQAWKKGYLKLKLNPLWP